MGERASMDAVVQNETPNTATAPPSDLMVPSVLVRASASLSGLSRAGVWAATLTALAIIGVLDMATGPQISFSIFYLIPVVMSAWHLGWRPSLVVVVLGAGVWLLAERLSGRVYDVEMIQYWNALVRAALFFVVAYTLALHRQALTHERQLARTDGLTGLPNTRSFNELAERELHRLRRKQLPVSLAYIDIDDFKSVNDTLGHAAGDDLLQQVAGAIFSAVRAIDVTARLGGDEFVVMLPEATQDGARIVISRVLDRLNAVAAEGDWPVGFSAGVVTFTAPPDEVQPLILAADRAMYEIKHAGGRGARYSVGSGGAGERESGG
ncbi:hypothetical protein BH23GEM10_BH23GEM10_02230 [soil metagenome]